MKTKRGIPFAFRILATGILLMAVAAVTFKRPLEEGYWLWRLESGTETQRERAAENLVRFPSRRSIRSLVGVHALAPRDSRRRNFSGKALLAMGHRAVPVLLGLLDDEDCQDPWIVESLIARGGPTTVPFLIEWLRAPSAYRRRTASRLLGQIGLEAVPFVIELLSHESAWVRTSAAFTLGEIGGEASDAVEALTEAFDDENRLVRRFAVDALERIGAGEIVSGKIGMELAHRQDNAQSP